MLSAPRAALRRWFSAGWAVACLSLAPESCASLIERCAWPPPGGPAVRPDSVNVEVAPIVGDLDGDGVPEIVTLSFVDGFDDNLGEDGIVRILSGADCSEILAVADVGCVTCFGDAACRSLDVAGQGGIFCPACTPAIADLDGDGDMEIVVLTETNEPGGTGRRAVILDHSGAFVACTEATSELLGPVAAVALADLEGDGSAEIIARDVAWRASGQLAWEHPLSGIGATMAADLDGDGLLEVTTGQVTYRADGSTLWASGPLRGASPAVADLNLDCLPDLVITQRNGQAVHVLDPLTGAIRASAPIPAADCPPRIDGQGGPPTLADVDGDCVPEIGVAGCRRYVLYKYLPGPPEQLVQLWEAVIDDDTSRITGSAIFDLDGDGTAEVLYNDHQFFRVFDGITGAVESILPNTTNTLLEFPVVADANGDGAAEILLAANAYSFCCDAGLRVLVDDAVTWAPARPLFNQHSYHVTNILDDGTLPAPEERSWSRHNTFRSQGEPLRDDAAGPVLDGVPAHVSASCAAVPPPPLPSASGGCDDEPAITLDEEIVPGPCPGSHDIVRTWTATDRCGRTARDTQVVTVRDDQPPSITAPPDLVATCAAPEAPVVVATDDCDAAPAVTLVETLLPGPCPLEFTILRRWEALDSCGNAASAEQRVEVRDDGPPVLVGVPSDAVVDCGAVPDPADVRAVDGCDAAPLVEFEEERIDGPCPSTYRLVRRWTATDACGRVAIAAQVIEVVDRTPPTVVSPPQAACIWPPNHWMVCFGPDAFQPVIVDDCPGEVSWRFVGCASDQPEDDLGDGHHAPDCMLAEDGSVCVRAERQGTKPEGRHYGISIVARDACGNESAPIVIGDIHVPHDQSPRRRDCLVTTDVGTKNGPRRGE